MLFRTLIPPIKYHKDIICTLLFDEQNGNFVIAGWYKSFYFPQSAAGQILSACYDIDRPKSSDYIKKMVTSDSVKIRELAEYLIVFWMRSTATPILMSCGNYRIEEFHNLPQWIRENFFIHTIQSNTSTKHKHFKNPQLLVPNIFRLESSDLGEVRFVASWGDVSITAKPLSVFSIRSIQTLDNVVLISGIPFCKEFQTDLLNIFPSLLSISILFEVNIWLSRWYALTNRKKFNKLDRCTKNMLLSRRLFHY